MMININPKQWLSGGILLLLVFLASHTFIQPISRDQPEFFFESPPIGVSDNPSSFLSRWDTRKTGPSASHQIELPLLSTGTYNFTVDWGDGIKENITDWNQGRHSYATPGIYNVNITGTCWGWRFGFEGDKRKLLEISQWGSLRLGNLSFHFYGCLNLNLTATDAPDLTETTSLFSSFAYCWDLGSSGNMSSWDVSGVTNMQEMFREASSFNQDISGWDTSSVTNMDYMFLDVSPFNQDLSGWDVSSVTTMRGMFSGASSFNHDIGGWDVSGGPEMYSMFYDASSFNQPLGGWDVSKVTSMRSMFNGATSFNQPIGNWNVSSVTDMGMMFYGASSFNQDIGGWDVSGVIDMIFLFRGASSFNQPIGSWDVSGVTNMRWIFRDASSFNQSIDGWDISGITDMGCMFYGASSFNQPLGSWDVSSVTSMGYMFHNAYSFNQPLGSWDVSSVVNMSRMFYGASSFNQPIGSWDVSNVADMEIIFYGASSFNQDIDGWDVSGLTDMGGMFYGASSFNQPLGGWNVSGVTDMGGMFAGASSFNQSLEGWNVSRVTNMQGMFRDATSFNQPLEGWNVSRVSNMREMFDCAISFNQPLGGWNVSRVWTMYDMFSGAISFNQPLGGWDVSGVTYMQGMFFGVTLSTSNYDNLLIGWSVLSLHNGVSFNGGNSQYGSIASVARNTIISTYGWTITDGGPNQPLVSQPPDVTYQLNATGNRISWNITNVDPGPSSTYTILIDGTPGSPGTWISGVPINLSVDGLTFGQYNYTINASNGYGWSVQDTVIVTVYQLSITHPPDLTCNSSFTGCQISWNVTSTIVSSTSYTILLNGKPIASGSWTTGVPVTQIVNDLVAGDYNYTIIASDDYGGLIQDTVIVTVLKSPMNSIEVFLYFFIPSIVAGSICMIYLIKKRNLVHILRDKIKKKRNPPTMFHCDLCKKKFGTLDELLHHKAQSHEMIFD